MYPLCTPYVYCAYSSYVAYAEAAPHDPKLAGTFGYRPEVMVCIGNGRPPVVSLRMISVVRLVRLSDLPSI